MPNNDVLAKLKQAVKAQAAVNKAASNLSTEIERAKTEEAANEKA